VLHSAGAHMYLWLPGAAESYANPTAERLRRCLTVRMPLLLLVCLACRCHRRAGSCLVCLPQRHQPCLTPSTVLPSTPLLPVQLLHTATACRRNGRTGSCVCLPQRYQTRITAGTLLPSTLLPLELRHPVTACMQVSLTPRELRLPTSALPTLPHS
jgi:hypothetical protein